MLAVMGVATYGCLYLLRRYSKLFLDHGGDPEWLRGKLPPKLTALKTINCKLAYSPWSLSKEDFQPLLQYYSMKQITYIIVLLAHYQSLACIAMSNGILPEVKGNPEDEVVELGLLKDKPLWNFKHESEKDLEEEASSKILSLADLASELEQQHYKSTQHDIE